MDSKYQIGYCNYPIGYCNYPIGIFIYYNHVKANGLASQFRVKLSLSSSSIINIKEQNLKLYFRLKTRLFAKHRFTALTPLLTK